MSAKFAAIRSGGKRPATTPGVNEEWGNLSSLVISYSVTQDYFFIKW
jgi:hypothetical protein